MSSLDETRSDRLPAADVIGGLLAVSSIVLSGIAMGFGLLLQLDAHPARVVRRSRSSSPSSPHG